MKKLMLFMLIAGTLRASHDCEDVIVMAGRLDPLWRASEKYHEALNHTGKYAKSPCHLERANLAAAVLRGKDLKGALLMHANLAEAQLTATKLNKANLTGAVLHAADAGGASFKQAILHNASLVGAILSNANFDGADLTGADLTSATLNKTDCDRATRLPQYYDCHGGHIRRLAVPVVPVVPVAPIYVGPVVAPEVTPVPADEELIGPIEKVDTFYYR